MKFHTRTGVLSSCGATLFIGKNRSLMRKLPLPLLCNGSSRRILLWQLPFCFALKSPFLHSSTTASHHRPLSVSFINEVLLFLIGLANCSTKALRSSTHIFIIFPRCLMILSLLLYQQLQRLSFLFSQLFQTCQALIWSRGLKVRHRQGTHQ